MARSPLDLDARRPVWCAMSELFLDTEVRWQLPLVARRCADSVFSADELTRIFWREVFPLCRRKLFQVAGEWVALTLDEDELVRLATSTAEPGWWRRRGRSLVRAEWTSVEWMLRRLREEPPEQRPLLERAWDVFCRRYFEAPGEPAPFLPESVATLERARFPLGEEWARFEPIARAMLLREEAIRATERAAEVRRVCVQIASER